MAVTVLTASLRLGHSLLLHGLAVWNADRVFAAIQGEDVCAGWRRWRCGWSARRLWG
jgi:hypothetical protein